MVEILFEKEKEEIVNMCIRLYQEKLIVGTWGNLSVRIKNDDKEYVVITPTGMEYEKASIQDMMVVDMEGNVIDGVRKPSSELNVHLSIYKARPDVNSVIHTHSTYASSCGVAGVGIPAIVEDMIQHVGGNIRVAKYALPGSEEFGQYVVSALEERNGAILKSHGAVGVGKDIKAAYKSCVLIEKTAQIYINAKILGHVNMISAEDAKTLSDYYNNQYGK